MNNHGTGRHRRLMNHVTAIKLALQMLERKTELSSEQRRLANTALAAADALTADLLDQGPIEQRHGLAIPEHARVGAGRWSSHWSH